MKDGYEPQDVFFDAKDWYRSKEEARRHVKQLTVILKKKESVAPESDQRRVAEEQQGKPSPHSSTEHGESYRQYQLANYTFQVPVDWTVGTRSDQEHMRGMLDVGSGAQIAALSVFTSGDDCAVTVYEIVLQAGQGNEYINRLQTANEEKFRTGKSRGLVKNAFENRKTKTGMFDALLLDWESHRGKLPRSRQWVLHTTQLPDKVVVVISFCNNRGYEVTKAAIDQVASSVTANVKGDEP